MWRLANPWFLLTLIVPIALLILHFISHRKGRASILFSGGHLLQGLPQSWRTMVAPHLHWLRYPGLLLLSIALSRPQTGNAIQEIETFGVDIMLILDVSGTMATTDMIREGREIDRLDAAKTVMAGFIDGRQSDRIGLIAFGTNSLTRCPLTVDYDLVSLALDEITLNLFPREQRKTAIGNAIATGVARLANSDARSKVIILLTDGDNTAGNISPKMAAEIASDETIRVHTIGFGSPGSTDVDEASLKEISSITGGQFFVSTSLEDLKKVYNVIDDLEKSEVVIKNFQQWHEWFHLFLWPGCLLLFLEVVLNHLVCRRIP